MSPATDQPLLPRETVSRRPLAQRGGESRRPGTGPSGSSCIRGPCVNVLEPGPAVLRAVVLLVHDWWLVMWHWPLPRASRGQFLNCPEAL